MLGRRTVLGSIASLTAVGAAIPAAQAAGGVMLADLRGSIDAEQAGLRREPGEDQSATLNRLLQEAAIAGRPLFLPPGNYVVSDIELPAGTHLTGVPGASRLVYSGNGRFLTAPGGERLTLSGLVMDGGNRWLGEGVGATLEIRDVARLVIDDCEFLGSLGHAIALERCGGRISRNRISGASEVALYAVDSTGLTISENNVLDCGNGGILVHRWQIGEDNTIVTNNRIERIAAASGGTGQYGNGINVFRAGNVMIANNHVSDCAFSAIRSNSGSNVQITGNQCLRSGETAIYAEFAFQGAIIAGNLIDGGANGISVANFNEGGRLANVANNIVRNIVEPGPYPPIGPGFGWGIAVEADTAVTGNSIEHVSKWGILLGWGPFLRNVTVTGNMVRDVPVGVAVSVVEEAREALISDNVIEGASGGAVVGFRWGEPATADLAGAATLPRHLTISGNRVS